MAKVSNIFVNGRMDSDTHYSLQDNKGYVRAENLRISGKGNDGAFQFIKGSERVSDTYAEQGMVVLGAYEGANNKNYFLLAMPNGKSKIIEYDVETKTTRLIIQDVSVLRFDLVRWNKGELIKPYKYILSIDQIGDLLFISNEVWEYPRVINIKRDYSRGFTEEDIVLAKKPPMLAPKITITKINKTDNQNRSGDKDLFVNFAYRYKYIDGDYSTLSFYSDTAFLTKDEYVSGLDSENISMVNTIEKIKLSVNSGGKNVSDIEVYAREHGSNTAYMIYSVNKKQAGIGDYVVINDIEFNYSKNYEVLNEEATNMLYSNIPKYPKTQTTAGNRILFGNYREGYDLEENIDFEVVKKQAVPNSINRHTAISMKTYKVGVVYFNDYNESTTVLLPTNQTKSEIEISFEDRLKRNTLQVKLLTAPPKFATKMKFVVKSESLNYNTINIYNYKKIGSRLFLYIKGDDINKVKKDDIIIRIDHLKDIYEEYKVLDISIKNKADGYDVSGTFLEIKLSSKEEKLPPKQSIEFSRGWGSGILYERENEKTRSDNLVIYFPKIRRIGGETFRTLTSHIKADYLELKTGDLLEVSLWIKAYRYISDDFSGSSYWGDSTLVKKANFVLEENIDLYKFIENNFYDEKYEIEINDDSIIFKTNTAFQNLADNIFNLYNQKGFRYKMIAVLGINIKRGDNLIFRTKNKDNIESMYYETPKTYLVKKGKVISDRYDEDGKPLFDIGFYNGYCWGNGVESYKIKDKFNAKELKYKFRGNAYEKNGYKQTHRKNDLTYSGIYNYELGINKLSEFNPSLANWKTLPIHYGEIQRIISTDGDISVFCNDKVIQQLYGKSILMDMTGNENVGLSKDVLGDYRVLPYEFGISNNPESIAKYSDILFFTDKNRARFLMKQGNNIEEINAFGGGFYNEGIGLLKEHCTFLGSFDEANNEYIVGIDQNFCIGFNVNNKGFTSYYNYQSDYLLGSYGRHYACYQGIIYENEATEDYNNFVGQGNQPAKLKFVVAPEMGTDKVFKAIALQSNTAWNVEVSTNLTHTYFTEKAFTQKESFYYSEIYRDNRTTQNIKGVGIVESVEGNKVVFTQNIENDVAVGDVLANENLKEIATIKHIIGNEIILENTTDIKVGEYMVAQRKMLDGYRPDGVPMRGKWAEITLTKNGNKAYYITAVNTEVIQSKL